MDDVISIIITGGGAPGIAGTIYSIRNNPDQIKFRIITTDIKDDVVGKYMSDAFYVVPSPEFQEDYFNILKGIIEKENVKVILPQTTRELFFFAKYKNEFLKMGTKVIVSDYKAIEEANDKFLLLEKAKKVGVPYPQYYLTRSEDEFIKAINNLGYPKRKVVVKPRVSNGMRGLRIVTESVWAVNKYLSEKPDGIEINLEMLLKILRNGKWPELLVTEYLNGPEYTVDVFRNKDGVVAIPRLREKIRSGISFEARVELRDDLIKYSTELAEALDLKYCFGFQFKLSQSGVPKLLECNPRVQGTMVVSTFAGFNMIYYSVKEAIEGQVDISNIRLVDGIKFKRYWGGIVVNEEDKLLGKI
jgi:carbamoyl-phosphate synthase large subunit